MYSNQDLSLKTFLAEELDSLMEGLFSQFNGEIVSENEEDNVCDLTCGFDETEFSTTHFVDIDSIFGLFSVNCQFNQGEPDPIMATIDVTIFTEVWSYNLLTGVFSNKQTGMVISVEMFEFMTPVVNFGSNYLYFLHEHIVNG